MSLPLKYRKDSVKRREYIQRIVGLPDGQMGLKAIICEGSTCNKICPNWVYCNDAGTCLGGDFISEAGGRE